MHLCDDCNDKAVEFGICVSCKTPFCDEKRECKALPHPAFEFSAQKMAQAMARPEYRFSQFHWVPRDGPDQDPDRPWPMASVFVSYLDDGNVGDKKAWLERAKQQDDKTDNLHKRPTKRARVFKE